MMFETSQNMHISVSEIETTLRCMRFCKGKSCMKQTASGKAVTFTTMICFGLKSTIHNSHGNCCPWYLFLMVRVTVLGKSLLLWTQRALRWRRRRRLFHLGAPKVRLFAASGLQLLICPVSHSLLGENNMMQYTTSSFNRCLRFVPATSGWLTVNDLVPSTFNEKLFRSSMRVLNLYYRLLACARKRLEQSSALYADG